MSPPIKWTPAVIDQCRRLAALGKTRREVAAMLVLNAGSLKHYAHVHGIVFAEPRSGPGIKRARLPPPLIHRRVPLGSPAEEVAAALAQRDTAPLYRGPISDLEN